MPVLAVAPDTKQVSVVGRDGRVHLAVADPHVSQTVVFDRQAWAPSGARRRVSYPVSDSMSCRRHARVPVSRAPYSSGLNHRRTASTTAPEKRHENPLAELLSVMGLFLSGCASPSCATNSGGLSA